METIIATKEITTDMKKKLRDIQMAISWRDFANTYFQRSSSWFYHKMDGIDGNGGVGGFTTEEAEQLRGALFDLSRRIRVAAENIWFFSSLSKQGPHYCGPCSKLMINTLLGNISQTSKCSQARSDTASFALWTFKRYQVSWYHFG